MLWHPRRTVQHAAPIGTGESDQTVDPTQRQARPYRPRHPQVRVAVDATTVLVDVQLAPLIEGLWQLGISTRVSCQSTTRQLNLMRRPHEMFYVMFIPVEHLAAVTHTVMDMVALRGHDARRGTAARPPGRWKSSAIRPRRRTRAAVEAAEIEAMSADVLSRSRKARAEVGVGAVPSDQTRPLSPLEAQRQSAGVKSTRAKTVEAGTVMSRLQGVALESDTGWARGDLNPHVLSNTGT